MANLLLDFHNRGEQMTESFIVQTNSKVLHSLIIHSSVAVHFNLQHNEIRNLRFGVKTIKIKIKVSNQMSGNTLLISKNITDFLHLPLSSNYQLIICNQDIIIGPFIGILASKNKTTLIRKLTKLLDIVQDYDAIGGTIVTFSLDQIMTANRTINGFVYNPMTKKWESGFFYYPAVVLIRTYLSAQKRYRLEKLMGNVMINNKVFNKWNSYKLLSPLKENHPATFLYESPDQIFENLQKYKCVYLKPLISVGGKRIKKIFLNRFNTISVLFHKRGRKKRITFKNKNSAYLFFQKSFVKQKWIIQQPIELLNFNNSIIDFRCIVVKDGGEDWKEMGIIARYSTKGNIVTNVSSGGKAEMGFDSLKKVLNLSDYETNRLCELVAQLSIQAVKLHESAGSKLGTAGVDIGIDKNQRLWLIEVNLNNPGHDIALDANNPELYRQIVKTNMLYLKKLAGF